MVIMCITLSLAPEVLNYDPVTCAADMWYVLRYYVMIVATHVYIDCIECQCL